MSGNGFRSLLFSRKSKKDRQDELIHISDPFELMAKSAVLNLDFPELKPAQEDIKDKLEEAHKNFTIVRKRNGTNEEKYNARLVLKDVIPEITQLMGSLLKDEQVKLLSSSKQDTEGLPTDLLKWQTITENVMNDALKEFGALLTKCSALVEKASKPTNENTSPNPTRRAP